MSGTLISPIAAMDVDEFAALMEPLQPLSDKVALAVSGGPDSMALAVCFKKWAQRDFMALIVDHGLRADSAAEAEHVKTRLSNIGITAKILRWDHTPLTGRVHERAREARYHLMFDACRRLGASDLLIAHHREDQAETILMRLSKGTGVDGLAGMAAQSVREGVRLLRPFLAVPKDRLIATCRAAGIDFVRDPSNSSEKFARGRIRKILPLLADEGLTVETLANMGMRAAEVKDALDFYTGIFLRDAAMRSPGGTLRVDRTLLRSVPRAIGLRAVTACLRYIHDDSHPPEHDSLGAFLDVFLDPTLETTRTLYGCLASVTATRVMFLREPSAVTDALKLRVGEAVLWDKRWFVTAQEDVTGTILRALGEQPHDLIDRLAPDLRHKIPQGRIRASLPALWRGDRLHAIPSFDPKDPLSLCYRKLSFP